MRIVIATLSILFAVAVVGVALMNPEPITLVLWPGDPQYSYPDTPVSAVIFLSAFAGFVFTGIIAILEGGKTRLANRRLRAQSRRLQQELEALRRPSLDLGSVTYRTEPALPLSAEESGTEDTIPEE